MRGRTSDGKPRWLVTAARTVRTSRRLSSVGNRAVELVQGNRTIVDVATRLFAYAGGMPVVHLRAGASLDGVPQQERLPIVLIQAAEATEEEIPALLEQLAEIQGRTTGFRPVLLLSSPAFRLVRAYGWPVELVVPQSDWDFDEEWEDYLAGREAMILTRYLVWSRVGVVDGRLDPAGVRLLERLATYRPWEARAL